MEKQWTIKHVRVHHKWEWATVFTREAPGCGEIVIHSSFGEYAHYWSHIGDTPFVEFLADCDNSYLLSKFRGAKNCLDSKATAKRIRQTIIEDRRFGNLNKDKARELWNWIDDLGDYFGDFNDHDLSAAIQDSNDAYMHFVADGDPPFVYDYDNQSKRFMLDLWPLIVEALKTATVLVPAECGAEVK